MRKFQLEMGGKNPIVVLADADLPNAVECAVNGAYFSTGQRCTASSRIIVEEPVYARFADLLTERMRALVVDDALKPGTHVGPVVDEAQLNQDLSYIEIGRDEGARLALGGERLNRGDPWLLHGAGSVPRRRQFHAHLPRGDLRPRRSR